MPTAYGYIRASTLKQQISPEAQREAIKAYFEFKLKASHTFGGHFEDPATSAGKEFAKRKAGAQALIRLEKGDCLVITKLDRGFRSTVDCLSIAQVLEQRGIALHLLDCQVDTGSPMGKMYMTIIAAFAEFERSRIRDRTKEALAHLKAKGVILGRIPKYPYKIVVRGPSRKRVYDEELRMIGRKLEELNRMGYSISKLHLWCKEHRINIRGGVPSLNGLKAIINEERRLQSEEQAKGQAS